MAVKADLIILSPVIGLSGCVAFMLSFMLSYKMDFSSCNIMPGFGKSSHIWCIRHVHSLHMPHPKTASELHSVHVHEMLSAWHHMVYQKR